MQCAYLKRTVIELLIYAMIILPMPNLYCIYDWLLKLSHFKQKYCCLPINTYETGI